jgi:hypothetical protein
VLRGEYIPEPLPNGATRLGLSNQHRIATDFHWYAHLWTDAVMADLQGTILRVVQNVAKRGRRAGRGKPVEREQDPMPESVPVRTQHERLPLPENRHMLKRGGFSQVSSGTSPGTRAESEEAPALVVAHGPAGHRDGWRCGCLTWLLAQQDELARPLPGMYLSGLHRLRYKALVRRRSISWLWSLQLRPSTITCIRPCEADEK